MVRSALLWALKASFALALFTGPASAVTFVDITPGNTNNAGAPYVLTFDTNYTYNSPTQTSGPPLDDIFLFQYSPPPTLAAVSSVAINNLSPFFPMTLNWWFNTVNDFSTKVAAQAPVSSASPGSDIDTALSLSPGAGFYWLELIGTRSANGGQYNLSVLTSETPLPASIWLLASAFAGGAGMIRLRRRKSVPA
jgi:hypothetical protein